MFGTVASKKNSAASEPAGVRVEAGQKTAEPDSNPTWQALVLNSLPIQRKLAVSQPDDPSEREADATADRVMQMEPVESADPHPLNGPFQAQRKEQSPGSGTIDTLPSNVQKTLQSPGQPLDSDTRTLFESRFGNDFRHVRVHNDSRAADSARSLNALAFTLGNKIVFGAGQYAPQTSQGGRLLAHELTHVSQQQTIGSLAVQRQQPRPAQPAQAPPPRQDYVFIMGQDPRRSRNPFYRVAQRFYRAHVPNAIFVTTLRSLDAVLIFIATNVAQPIGNLYIVSHANEDGTLSFALNAADIDTRVTVPELRGALHPTGGNPRGVTQLAGQIDSQTRIHIKGCDIGRTPGMVELIDEAFGGRGTVTAPTHEQGYGVDPTLAQAERTRVHDQMMTAFRGTLPPLPPAPARVDPTLRGAARTQALADRRAAVQARQRAIRQQEQAIAREERRIVPQVDRAAELAGTYESFSGPMFQRPGTVRFTAAELQPQVQRLYSHLSAAQQRNMVQQLVAPDRQNDNVANLQGQRGQRVYRHRRLESFNFTEPRNLAEANRAWAGEFRRHNFRATALRPMQRVAQPGGTQLTLEVEGQILSRRAAPVDHVLTFPLGTVPDNAAMIASGRSRLPNPERYNWRVEERHTAAGSTTRTVIAERVVAYLHHGSLDPSAHSHFTRPETDPDFFTTSTFVPPPPAQPRPRNRP